MALIEKDFNPDQPRGPDGRWIRVFRRLWGRGDGPAWDPPGNWFVPGPDKQNRLKGARKPKGDELLPVEPDPPDEADLREAAMSWKGAPSSVRTYVPDILAGHGVPPWWGEGHKKDRRRSAALMNAVATAPPSPVPLYRGIPKTLGIYDGEVKVGQKFRWGPSGFSTSKNNALRFTRDPDPRIGAKDIGTLFVLEEGASALDIDALEPGGSFSYEREYVTAGTFEVTKLSAERGYSVVHLRQVEPLGMPDDGGIWKSTKQHVEKDFNPDQPRGPDGRWIKILGNILGAGDGIDLPSTKRKRSTTAGMGRLARTLSPRRSGGHFDVPEDPIPAGFEEEDYTYKFFYGDMEWETFDQDDLDERWYSSYSDWSGWSGNWGMRVASASLMDQPLPAAIGDEYIEDKVREILITGEVRKTPEGPDGQIIEVRDRDLLAPTSQEVAEAQRYVEEAATALDAVYWSRAGGGPGNPNPIYRGITVDTDDDVLSLQPGDEFVMPLSAFTPSRRIATSFTDHGDDTTAGGDVGVIFRLPPGTSAKAAPSGYEDLFEDENGEMVEDVVEYVTAGRFAVESVRWVDHANVEIELSQTAVFEPGFMGRWEEVSKKSHGIPDWVWKLSGSFSQHVEKGLVVVPPYKRLDGTWVDGYSYYREDREPSVGSAFDGTKYRSRPTTSYVPPARPRPADFWDQKTDRADDATRSRWKANIVHDISGRMAGDEKVADAVKRSIDAPALDARSRKRRADIKKMLELRTRVRDYDMHNYEDHRTPRANRFYRSVAMRVEELASEKPLGDKSQDDLIAQAMEERKDLWVAAEIESVTDRIVDEWSSTSFKSALAYYVQSRAAKLFDVDELADPVEIRRRRREGRTKIIDSKGLDVPSGDHGTSDLSWKSAAISMWSMDYRPREGEDDQPETDDIIDGFLRAVYTSTQEYLEERRVDQVNLYRGVDTQVIPEDSEPRVIGAQPIDLEEGRELVEAARRQVELVERQNYAFERMAKAERKMDNFLREIDIEVVGSDDVGPVLAVGADHNSRVRSVVRRLMELEVGYDDVSHWLVSGDRSDLNHAMSVAVVGDSYVADDIADVIERVFTPERRHEALLLRADLSESSFSYNNAVDRAIRADQELRVLLRRVGARVGNAENAEQIAAMDPESLTAGRTVFSERVVLQPLSSFSTSYSEAGHFGPLRIGMRVPRERIFSTSETGIGALLEDEVVVIGGEVNGALFSGAMDLTDQVEVSKKLTGYVDLDVDGDPDWPKSRTMIKKRRVVVPPYVKADGTRVSGYTYDRKGALPDLSVAEFVDGLTDLFPALKIQRAHRFTDAEMRSDGSYRIETRPQPATNVYGADFLTGHERAVFFEHIADLARTHPKTAGNIGSIVFNQKDFEINAAASTSVLEQSVYDADAPDSRRENYGISFHFSVESFRSYPNPDTVNTYWTKRSDLGGGRDANSVAQKAREEGTDIIESQDDADDHIRELMVHEWTHARHFTSIAEAIDQSRMGMDGLSAAKLYPDFFRILLDGEFDPDTVREPMKGLPHESLMSEARNVSQYATTRLAEAVAEAATLRYRLPKAEGLYRRVIPQLTTSVDSLAKAEHSHGLDVLPDGSIGIKCQLSMHRPDEVSKVEVTNVFDAGVLELVPDFADGTKIVGASKKEVDAVRLQIQRAVARGEDLDKVTARIKRLHLGLTPRDSIALDNYEQSLRRRGYPDSRVRRLTREYSKRLQDRRNQVIAGQEVAIAYGDAKRAEWKDAQDAGILSKRAYRVWHTHPDERTCKVCRPLDGTHRPLDAPGPPLHVQCRCWETIHDPVKKKGMLEEIKVRRQFRGNQYRRTSELVLTQRAQELLAEYRETRDLQLTPKGRAELERRKKDKKKPFGPFPKKDEKPKPFRRFGPFPKSEVRKAEVSKELVVVPPYQRADGTWVDGYSYWRGGRRRSLITRLGDLGQIDNGPGGLKVHDAYWTGNGGKDSVNGYITDERRGQVKHDLVERIGGEIHERAKTDRRLREALDHRAKMLGVSTENDFIENDFTAGVVNSWAESSWKSPESFVLQEAVRRKFAGTVGIEQDGIRHGTGGRFFTGQHYGADPFTSNPDGAWGMLTNEEFTHEDLDVLMDAFVDVVYRQTQDDLRSKGITEVPLYRRMHSVYATREGGDPVPRLVLDRETATKRAAKIRELAAERRRVEELRREYRESEDRRWDAQATATDELLASLGLDPAGDYTAYEAEAFGELFRAADNILHKDPLDSDHLVARKAWGVTYWDRYGDFDSTPTPDRLAIVERYISVAREQRDASRRFFGVEAEFDEKLASSHSLIESVINAMIRTNEVDVDATAYGASSELLDTVADKIDSREVAIVQNVVAGGVVLQPVSSFSTLASDAQPFGEYEVRATVPAERIFSTALTGPGALIEHEMLVIGGETDLTATFEGHGVDNLEAVIKAQGDWIIHPDYADADWIKRGAPDTFADIGMTEEVEKGDKPGHPFRGNQWTGGIKEILSDVWENTFDVIMAQPGFLGPGEYDRDKLRHKPHRPGDGDPIRDRKLMERAYGKFFDMVQQIEDDPDARAAALSTMYRRYSADKKHLARKKVEADKKLADYLKRGGSATTEAKKRVIGDAYVVGSDGPDRYPYAEITGTQAQLWDALKDRSYKMRSEYSRNFDPMGAKTEHISDLEPNRAKAWKKLDRLGASDDPKVSQKIIAEAEVADYKRFVRRQHRAERRIARNSDVFIQFHDNPTGDDEDGLSPLEQFLTDGVYATIHDPKGAENSIADHGGASVEHRESIELLAYGLAPSAKDRPISGYLWDKGSHGILPDIVGPGDRTYEMHLHRLGREGDWGDWEPPEIMESPYYSLGDPRTPIMSNYGSVAVKLKPSVRKRSTFVIGDSMADISSRTAVPTPLTNPGVEGIGAYNIQGASRPSDVVSYDNVPYIESQIHGGVTLEDVDTIYFGIPPSERLIELMNAKGVRWVFEHGGKEERRAGLIKRLIS